MIEFIVNNYPTIIVVLILAVVILLAILKIIGDKRNGKSSCGDCSGCAFYGNCRKKPPQKP